MSLFKDTTAGGAFAERIRKASEHRPPAAPLETRPVRRHEERAERKPIFVNATLVWATSSLPVVVTNVNALGARVEFMGSIALHSQLKLVAPNIGLNSRVRVAWQHGGNAGLIFVKPEPGSA